MEEQDQSQASSGRTFWIVWTVVIVLIVGLIVVAGLLLWTNLSAVAGDTTAAQAVATEVEVVPSLTVSPKVGQPGTLITVAGRNWPPGDTVYIGLEDPENAGQEPRAVQNVTVSEAGTFSTVFEYPADEPYWATLPVVLVTAEADRSDYNKITEEFQLLATVEPTPSSTPTATPTDVPTLTPTNTPPPTVTPPPTATFIPVPDPVLVEITDWRGAYWDNVNLSGDPVLVRNDQAIAFNWRTGAPAPSLPVNDFSARWTRLWDFVGGRYRFHLIVDDGARLWIDDRLVMNRWRAGYGDEVTTDYVLEPGVHELRLEYYDQLGLARIEMWWERVSPPTTFPDWRGEYWANGNLRGDPILIRNDQFIDFNWGLDSPMPGVPIDDFSARWSRWATYEPGLYRFFARADDAVRIFIDGRLILNEWHPTRGANLYTTDLNLGGRQWVEVEYAEHTGEALIEVWAEEINLPAPTPTDLPIPTPTPPPTPTPTPDPEALALDAATSHLAVLTGLPTSEIDLVSIRYREWPNSRLGCPTEGVAGAPVVTPGYLIILEARGREYEYHADQNGQIVLCQATPTPYPVD